MLSFPLLIFISIVILLPAHPRASKVNVSLSRELFTQTAKAFPTATSPIDNIIPPGGVDSPSLQDWCPSKIFCPGDLLQLVSLANLWSLNLIEDKNYFVMKPPLLQTSSILDIFEAIHDGDHAHATFEEIMDFVDTYFLGDDADLEPVLVNAFNPDPVFLKDIPDPLVKAFTQAVHMIWAQLVRRRKEHNFCNGLGCETTILPLNHSFVVPSELDREPYYWDSFWIMEGLLASELFDVANDTLQNFMDEIEKYGFIPNGGRIYYLNRSQPPLFIQMLHRYINVTNDKLTLKRALPLAERELVWWWQHRSINVTSPTSGQTHLLAFYNVKNSAPRPEVYWSDYHDAAALNCTGCFVSDLYAELASGAESGWDRSSRWMNGRDILFPDVRNTVPVDLNSILYRNHILLASLYPQESDDAKRNLASAERLRSGILDLFWNATKFAFYDFNIREGRQNMIFTAANFYPYWSGIIPNEVMESGDNAWKAFSSVNMAMNRWNGTFPATFVETDLKWDGPNAWPPHQYIILAALRLLPGNLTSKIAPIPPINESSFALIPEGQLNKTEDELWTEPLYPYVRSNLNGLGADVNFVQEIRGRTVLNGGEPQGEQEGWGDMLQRELANRYLASALCSWQATGGSVPDLLPRLSNANLSVTQSESTTGNIFDSFSVLDIVSTGKGDVLTQASS
ncbi:hypothetical protein D9758_007155 [Tetrapyrgos nigripes]|uniref:Trehalase n=1 Tax=Tetrapyrgos nigripes TaxID=182062 RepID=A0A8H5LMR0_9AGAR|nr:hypothetical protein D9758_007155 [Tetrapyrgos nigripes]